MLTTRCTRSSQRRRKTPGRGGARRGQPAGVEDCVRAHGARPRSRQPARVRRPGQRAAHAARQLHVRKRLAARAAARRAAPRHAGARPPRAVQRRDARRVPRGARAQAAARPPRASLPAHAAAPRVAARPRARVAAACVAASRPAVAPDALASRVSWCRLPRNARAVRATYAEAAPARGVINARAT